MRISERGLKIIKDNEGLVLDAYDDADGKPVDSWDQVAGTLSIGYGHTGDDVKPGMKITPNEAERLLESDVRWAERVVNEHVQVELSQSQFDALVSFVYNVGVGDKKRGFLGSTLLKRLNKGKYGAVPEQLARWNKRTIKGKLVQSAGLAKRRAEEAALWASESAQSHGEKPAPVKDDKKEVGGLGVSSIGAIGAALSEAGSKIQPLAQYSDILMYVFIGMMVTGICIVAYSKIKAAVVEDEAT